jgi:two-component system sensor histidine kinase ResE
MTCEVAGMQQTQRDFLANVTHDLRTPLTSIQGFSQAIVDGVAADPQAATRAATIIYDEAGRLNRMVQELLDLARLESGQFQMTWHTLQIADLLTAVAERLQPKAADKGVRLTVDVAPLPALAGDGDRLVQVFTNLLDNGIKHTAAGGSVTLEARSHPEPNGAGIVVKVRDTGDGIPAADLPHIFDRFYQVDKSRRSKDGAGLGLTISRQIIEAHGGQITVQSVEGLGTLFSVWLPTTPADSGTSKRRTVKPS